jgi:hypothetical protein
MYLPSLNEIKTNRDMVDVFGGYNHNLRISNGEFFDMKNLTSSYYPTLSPRGKRGTYYAPTSEAGVQGIIAKDTLCWVDGRDFYINGYKIEMNLSDSPKTLTAMGAYVIIMPDKKWVNTLKTEADGDKWGYIENTVTVPSELNEITFEMCRMDGSSIENVTSGDTSPANPNNLDYWIDTSGDTHSLKQWDATTAMWTSIATTYVKISSPGIGRGFSEGDGVTISGLKGAELPQDIQDIDGSFVIWNMAEDYIVIVGIISKTMSTTTPMTISRTMPELDYITEASNRLWGCRYGLNANGDVVNEIYACKLGDFKNWNVFAGISTDSYIASCGTDGVWTGAVTHLGYPVFFKEGFLHKVYGNYPSNYQIQTTACRGVERGSDKSLAIVNELLYYKSPTGVCVYDGSLPQEVSYAFGEEKYSDAVAGAAGNKYYISMKSASTNEYVLMVYDTARKLWHKEDDTYAKAFSFCRNEMYFIDGKTGKIRTIFGSGETDTKPVEWMAESGVIGTDMPDKKYISRLTIRLSLAIGSRVQIYAQYDSCGSWEHLGTLNGTTLKTFSVPVKPKRCDHMRLRIAGQGEAKIYSIVKVIEQGSDF